MIKPEFFIIGAPKCGTTALSEYLKDHPNICMAFQKESHFFMEDYPEMRLQKTLEEYLSLFRNARDKSVQVAGEASAMYLYSPLALRKILEFDRDAKVIVMLRNPVDLVYSFHTQQVYNLDEDVTDFESAWRLQKSRQGGKNIPARCRSRLLLQYEMVGRIGKASSRLLEIFPREQVQFILLDDFAQTTGEVYRSVLAFLEVSYDGRTDFPKVNENRYHKNSSLSSLLLKPPSYVAWLQKRLKIQNTGIGSFLLNMNATRKRREPLTTSFRTELIESFQDDVVLLSKILNRDVNTLFPIRE